jgi:predicted MFS family arabinose efflux permease
VEQETSSLVVSWSLVIIWLAFFCDYVLMFMAIPIFPTLGKSDVMTGCLFSAKACCQILSAPLLTTWVDRYGKFLLLGGLLVETISSVMFMLTHEYGAWLFARAISGVASAAIMSSGLSHLSKRHTKSEERAVVMGCATTGILSGTCIGPVMGGILHEISPGLPFLSLAVLELIVVVLIVLFLPSVKGEQKNTGGGGASTRELLQNRDVLRFLGILVVTNMGCGCVEGTIARHLHVKFGLSAGAQGRFYLLLAVSSVIFSAVSGDLGNRLGRIKVIRLGLLLQGVSTLSGASSSITLSAIAFTITGIGIGLIDGATPSLLGNTVTKHFGETGRIYVMSNTCVQLGFLFGPMAGNIIVANLSYGVCCVLAGSLMVWYSAYLGRYAQYVE